MHIRADTIFQGRNKWLPAEMLVEALEKSCLTDSELTSTVNVGTFNAAVGKSRVDFDGQMMPRYDETNQVNSVTVFITTVALNEFSSVTSGT
jgi:hypothetical protein